LLFLFFFSSRRRHTRFKCDWSSDVCSSDLFKAAVEGRQVTVVGTSIATCRPSTAALNAARTASSVLPKPTSPHTTRSIGRDASRSEERRVGKESRPRSAREEEKRKKEDKCR